VLADNGDTVEESVEARQSARSIQEAINRLPARYREIIRMRHEQQMAVGDIALATGAPEGTVKSWLFRARAHLAKDLQIELA
jgi:RNA polymerase sigma-70 factor (ECF subfamily)